MAGCIPVAIDIEALLRRVVADVFDKSVEVTYPPVSEHAHTHRVELRSADGRRHAAMSASYEVFVASIVDLGVSDVLLDYDDDEADKEPALRELALVVRAYLRGEGRVEYKRGLLRSYPVLKIVVDGQEWELRAPVFRRRAARR